MLTHPFEHMTAIARIIYSGMLDRFPNLKFILEEGNVGHALYRLDRLEEGWKFGEMLQGPQAPLNGSKKRPLEYLEDFHWAVESDDSLIGEAIRRWGAERILFSSDYPHSDTPCPGGVSGIKKALASFDDDDEAKVMWRKRVSPAAPLTEAKESTLSGGILTHDYPGIATLAEGSILISGIAV
jgi:predicted TIM-barrel fold metal-dependent hydrolase